MIPLRKIILDIAVKGVVLRARRGNPRRSLRKERWVRTARCVTATSLRLPGGSGGVDGGDLRRADDGHCRRKGAADRLAPGSQSVHAPLLAVRQVDLASAPDRDVVEEVHSACRRRDLQQRISRRKVEAEEVRPSRSAAAASSATAVVRADRDDFPLRQASDNERAQLRFPGHALGDQVRLAARENGARRSGRSSRFPRSSARAPGTLKPLEGGVSRGRPWPRPRSPSRRRGRASGLQLGGVPGELRAPSRRVQDLELSRALHRRQSATVVASSGFFASSVGDSAVLVLVGT